MIGAMFFTVEMIRLAIVEGITTPLSPFERFTSERVSTSEKDVSPVRKKLANARSSACAVAFASTASDCSSSEPTDINLRSSCASFNVLSMSATSFCRPSNFVVSSSLSARVSSSATFTRLFISSTKELRFSISFLKFMLSSFH